MESVKIPVMKCLPTSLILNDDSPPEIEIRFDPIESEDSLPANWPLLFLQHQLFDAFKFPGRFTPGAFHSTIVRKAVFRSEERKNEYVQQCNDIIQSWKTPQILTPSSNERFLGSDMDNQSPGGIYLFRNRNKIGKEN